MPDAGFSQTRDTRAGIARERVKGWAGTTTQVTGVSVLLGANMTIGARHFFWGGIMSDPLFQGRCHRDLAEECRIIAALCAASSEIRFYHSPMLEHYCRAG